MPTTDPVTEAPEREEVSFILSELDVSASGVGAVTTMYEERHRRAAAVIRALLADRDRLAAQVGGWRAMDSAPRDGTDILIWAGEECFSAWWEKGRFNYAIGRDCRHAIKEPLAWQPGPPMPDFARLAAALEPAPSAPSMPVSGTEQEGRP